MLFVATVAAISVNAQDFAAGSKFITKVNYGADSAKMVASTVKDGVIVINAGGQNAVDGQGWDNQFFITAGAPIVKGTPFTFSMEVKAVSATTLSTQAHADAGNYKHWAMVGTVPVTTDWTTYTFDGTMPNEADGANTIAFNLNDDKNVTSNVFYIRNVNWVSASYAEDAVEFSVLAGISAPELKAENFMVFTNEVSSTADFNQVSGTAKVSASKFGQVSATAFASVSNTLNKIEFEFSAKENGATLKLAEKLANDAKAFVAFGNNVAKAFYVEPVSVEVAAVAEFSVYPNPVNDVLNVACEAGVANVAIFDVAGRMVKVSNEDVINVADLKAGLYIVKVTDMNGANGTTKIMK